MLIAVDGIDGSGKSTLCAALLDQFGELAGPVVRPVEADHQFAAAVRDLAVLEPGFADRAAEPMQRAVAGHYLHQFAERVAREVRLHLHDGRVVVCDRYWYSLVANQHAFGVDCNEWLDALAELPRPDVAIRLVVDVDTAMSRVEARSGRPWYDVSFLRRVDDYLTAHSPSFGLVPVDGTRPVAELVDLVTGLVPDTARL